MGLASLQGGLLLCVDCRRSTGPGVRPQLSLSGTLQLWAGAFPWVLVIQVWAWRIWPASSEASIWDFSL